MFHEMTMDVRRRELGRDREGVRERERDPQITPAGGFASLKSSVSSSSPSPSSSSNNNNNKRSFDVAFLMAPDDLAKRRQHHLRLVTAATLMQPQLQAPTGLEDESAAVVRSAFTKVLSSSTCSSSSTASTVAVDVLQPTSPSSVSSGGGLSPDVTYQESMSPPTVLVGGHSPPPPAYLSSPGSRAGSLLQVSYLTGNSPGKGSAAAIVGGGSGSNSPVDHHPQQIPWTATAYPPAGGADKSPLRQSQVPRPLTLYRDSPVPYGGLYPFPGPGAAVPPHPLLNVTAALLPPSLAALTLPAQNVCAKCNVSFRMTSDLVYHMRSHHKNESGTSEAARRRREQEKLRCPVCEESFRERHHLTRHMTAHQDKEGDSDNCRGSDGAASAK